MSREYTDRRHAGRVLATHLTSLAPVEGRGDVVVLGLVRGGIPVAYEVADRLDAPLDVMVVRKLGVPGHEELAMGAVASGGVVLVNHELVRRLGITAEEVEHEIALERRELARREHLYRAGTPALPLAGTVVVLVDDGLATGASMRAAIATTRASRPARVVVAVPTASSRTCQELRSEADEVVCAATPPRFVAVGQSYEDFRQTSDAEVASLLASARAKRMGT